MKIKRPNMAKDVTKKKQRIAHNKAIESHEMFPECGDVLTSIMQGMDNTDLMAAMGLNKFQTCESSKTIFNEKSQSQIPSRNHASLSKLKKFGLSRKGPLMQKSQRTLKVLQHNRTLPKPRAHLAGLSNLKSFNNSVSSEKSKTKDVSHSRKVPTEKQVYNRIEVDGNQTKRNSIEKSKSKEITSKKLNPPVIKKKFPVKESSHIVESVSKKHESAIVKNKCSLEKSSHIINDKIADNSSDSDEYERFIQKEKKDLPKKSKKKSNNIKSEKLLKKVSRKRASKSVSTESDSDLTDEESSNSYKSKKKRKANDMLHNRQSTSSIKDKVPRKVSRKHNLRSIKYVSSSDSEMSDGPSTSYKERKKVHKKHNRSSDTSKEDSESQMDINDDIYHNSSESEDLPPPSEIMNGLQSTNNQFSVQMGNLHISELSFHSNEAYKIPSRDEPNILYNKTSSHEISNIDSLVSNNQPNALHKSSDIHSLVGSAQPYVSHKTSGYSSLDNVHTNAECVALQNNSVSNNSQQENSPKSLIVDLVESDNECESSFAVIPKIVMTSSQNQNDSQSYSEESEVELIDVIVPPDLPVSAERSDKNAGCTKNSSNELNIKTEKVDGTTHSIAKSQNTKSNPESQTSTISKTYEVTYTTGICQKPDEENESKDKIRKQLNLKNDKLHNGKSKSDDKVVKQLCLNNEVQSSIVSNAKDSFLLNKKVKKEPSVGDECEIILDTTSTSNSCTNLNLYNVQTHSNANIKVERDSTAAKQATAIHNINEDPVGTRGNSVVENAKDLLVLNKKVKKEPSDGDECEIILDTTSTSNTSTNLSNVQIHSNKSIKVERDCKAVKQTAIHIANDGLIGTKENSNNTEKKLHEVSCSNFTNLTSSHNSIQPTENETSNLKALLELLKHEFNTYQDILVTEQSVETTFKILEKCQAERLKSLKTKIIQCLESVPGNSDSNAIKIAVNKLLGGSPTSLKDGTKVSSVCPSSSTSDISMQDLKTLATMNLVPLSSISEKDIKPDFSKLQCALKKEQSPSYEINSMSFGEKCIVCAKDASAACQQCAKVFFCSNECGRKYWEDGHKNACVK